MKKTSDGHLPLVEARTNLKNLRDAMVKDWGAPVVARTEVARFSGGLTNARSCANNDSAGTGVAGRFRVGKKICYPAQALADWIFSRAEEVS
jgi:hypothetical protein